MIQFVFKRFSIAFFTKIFSGFMSSGFHVTCSRFSFCLASFTTDFSLNQLLPVYEVLRTFYLLNKID